jgi:hypothetical protein
MPMVHSSQTVHLSCAKIKTISEWIEMTFYLIHVAKECNQLLLKWFLSLWYIQHKSCTYLTSRLMVSPYGPKQDSTWPKSHRSTIGCVKMYVQRKPCIYLVLRLILSPNGPKIASIWPMSPKSTIGCAWEDFHAHGTFGGNRAPFLHLV